MTRPLPSVPAFIWPLLFQACGETPALSSEERDGSSDIESGDVRNPCGGSYSLMWLGRSAEPGDPCGGCSILECSGAETLVCRAEDCGDEAQSDHSIANDASADPGLAELPYDPDSDAAGEPVEEVSVEWAPTCEPLPYGFDFGEEEWTEVAPGTDTSLCAPGFRLDIPSLSVEAPLRISISSETQPRGGYVSDSVVVGVHIDDGPAALRSGVPWRVTLVDPPVVDVESRLASCGPYVSGTLGAAF